jgi:hypothetical protein
MNVFCDTNPDPSDGALVTLDVRYRLHCHGSNLRENAKTESLKFELRRALATGFAATRR